MIQVCCLGRLVTQESLDTKFIGLNPDPKILPKLDPRDAFLLADPSSSAGAYPVNGGSHPNSSSAATPIANVTWLRKTEYISREGVQRAAVQEQCVYSLCYDHSC